MSSTAPTPVKAPSKRGSGLFGRRKSSTEVTASSSATTTSTTTDAVGRNGVTVRKTRSFKRIRGLLTGESRKERKARKEREASLTTTASKTASTTPTTATIAKDVATTAATAAAAAERTTVSLPPVLAPDDDEATLYGVSVEERSVYSESSASLPRKDSLGSLLGDSSVADDEDASSIARTSSSSKRAYMLKVVLLLMDPETRRFELLQLEFDSLKALVSDVLAQIPISVTEEVLRRQTYMGICGKDGKEMAPTKLLATFCQGNEVLVAIPAGVDPKECARLAKPILGDDKVLDLLLASGIDASAWKDDSSSNKKKKKKVSSSYTGSASSTSSATSASSSASASSASTASTVSTNTREAPVDLDTSFDQNQVDDSISTKTKKSSSALTRMIMLVGIVVVAVGLQVIHIFISASIKPDHIVSPGIWLSKCGLLTPIPSLCEDGAYLSVDRMGTVSFYDTKRELAWKMQGQVCSSDKACIKGMQVKAGGDILVGGKHITHVTVYKDTAVFSPWPFAEKPNVKLVKSK